MINIKCLYILHLYYYVSMYIKNDDVLYYHNNQDVWTNRRL